MSDDARKLIEAERDKREVRPEDQERAVCFEDSTWQISIAPSPRWDRLQADAIRVHPHLERPTAPTRTQTFKVGGGLNPEWVRTHGEGVTVATAAQADTDAKIKAGLLKDDPAKVREALAGHLPHQRGQHVIEFPDGPVAV